VAQKEIFKNKILFQSTKVCYKVSLCGNFQRQRCSITIPPSTVHGLWTDYTYTCCCFQEQTPIYDFVAP